MFLAARYSIGCRNPYFRIWEEIPNLIGAGTADGRDQLVDRLVGERPHLIVGAVLNRMFDEQTSRVETQRLGLRLGGGYERIAGNKNAWKATAFEVGDVMHTA